MKLKRITAFITAAVVTIMSFSAVRCEVMEKGYSFNFTKEYEKGAKNLYFVRKYSEDMGYGFVDSSRSMPVRYVDTDKIEVTEGGFSVTENDPEIFKCFDEKGNEITADKSTTHNFGGMIFRVKVPKGGYHVEVATDKGDENSIISVNAMQPARMATAYWDAAKLVANKHKAQWKDNVWSFDIADGTGYIDVEIEPKSCGEPVVLKSIRITPVNINNEEKPTVYLLGDSTLKSYTFEEAPMCGWGQVFDRLFDKDKINVINYSMGGRSLKSMYQEGRLNDVLMTGAKGDIVLIQSGHNDEKTGADSDPTARFGVGSTEEMYRTYLEKYYIPAVKARGMIPVLVTPMTRVKEGQEVYKDSFTTKDREFPKVMREVAKEMNIPLVDLNKDSVEYLNSIGTADAEAIVLSLEAGETPGKTNSGSYANGHPQNKIDGTHMKEALAKQYALMVARDIAELSQQYTELEPMKAAMVEGAAEGNAQKVYPEMCSDVKGENAYYRNQIEKMVQLGIMTKDDEGNFRPKDTVSAYEYEAALEKLYGIELKDQEDIPLTREMMACINLDAYNAVFSEKPKYMTDYNGSNITPEDPNYDPNLVGEEAQYYPLAGFGTITDRDEIDEELYAKVEDAYELGLIRSEDGIKRGKMINGYKLQPKTQVTREKAAKSLYFMYVLNKDINEENDIVG